MSTAYVGEIRMFGFGRVPAGWLPCDGRLHAISQYEVLYSLIGTTYGGDGVNTFAAPDLRGRAPVHEGQGRGLRPRSLGEIGGSEAVVLEAAHMPEHTHTFSVTQGAASAATPGPTVTFGSLGEADTQYLTSTTGATQLPLAPYSCTLAGGSQPHDNMMPTTTVSFCIAYEGDLPPRADDDASSPAT